MKNFLFILFNLSALMLVNSANAYECPDIANNTKNGNIEHLKHVLIEDNGYNSNPGTVICEYGNGNDSYIFNYNDQIYLPSAIGNWNQNGIGLECNNPDPKECQFNDENDEGNPKLQKCPDSLTAYNQDILFSHALFSIYSSGNTIGNIRCFYPGGSQGIPNFSGLYEYSEVNNINNLWNPSPSYPKFECGAGSGFCKFYIVNNY